MRRPALLILALIAMLAPAPVLGQTSVTDALNGFDEDETERKPKPADDSLRGTGSVTECLPHTKPSDLRNPSQAYQ